MKKTMKVVKYLILAFILFAALLAFLLAKWYTDRYGDTGFMSIISTFMTPWKGCSNNLSISWKLNALLPAGILTLILYPIFFYRGKKFNWTIRKDGKNPVQLFPIKLRLSNIIFTVMCTTLVVVAAIMVRFPEFVVDYYFDDTKLYDDHYVSPDEVEITFPEKKRNLIYIYLESMETSFMSKEQGGAQKVDMIPELTQLAQENVNFSHNNGIGGWPRINHTTWTSAALVAQTSGLPLTMDLSKIEIGKFEGYLPGATNLQDILKEQGYYQTFMCGSDANFGSREEYYYLHGADHVYDLFTARKDGLIPEDYMVWWGFEDSKLFDYAKQELTEISKKDQPFAFTLLTVDTHHIDGYYDKSCCENQHSEQYENVISCSSRQVKAFVEWIQQQDFYENTTVVVVGDHQSMDNQYFVRNVEEGYDRHVYNCIINAPITTEFSKNRVFTPMDLFPTTLAALGCTIEGERLGIGTNLFSGHPTLAEELGLKYLNDQITKHSDYYVDHFIED
ncbi:MAG: LTA synthase family protein [Ruminococcaceae bacterium]|nr:LTA synthase family protein [Oscillospiraceae bacterium]